MLNNSVNFSNYKIVNTTQATDSSNDEIYNNLTSSNTSNNSLHPMNEAQAAFLSLPVVIQHALLQQQRIVCIANNPCVTTQSLSRLLTPTDIVVLFNDFVHAEYFSTDSVASKLPKLLFFRQNGDSLVHFGLPPRSNNVPAIEKMAKKAPVGLLFSNQPYQYPAPSDDTRLEDDPITAERALTIPATLKNLFDSHDHCRVLSEWHPVVKDYPSFAHIHTSAPTSGFLLYKLLLTARQHVHELKPKAAPLKIVLLGFNDETKTTHFWQGHNWQFERQQMNEAPYDVDIIRQY